MILRGYILNAAVSTGDPAFLVCGVVVKVVRSMWHAGGDRRGVPVLFQKEIPGSIRSKVSPSFWALGPIPASLGGA